MVLESNGNGVMVLESDGCVVREQLLWRWRGTVMVLEGNGYVVKNNGCSLGELLLCFIK
jgi:hypothetical protein